MRRASGTAPPVIPRRRLEAIRAESTRGGAGHGRSAAHALAAPAEGPQVDIRATAFRDLRVRSFPRLQLRAQLVDRVAISGCDRVNRLSRKRRDLPERHTFEDLQVHDLSLVRRQYSKCFVNCGTELGIARRLVDGLDQRAI